MTRIPSHRVAPVLLPLLLLEGCGKPPAAPERHSETSRQCGAPEAPRPPGAPCRGFADLPAPAVSFDESAYGLPECKRDTFAITDPAPAGHVPAAEIGDWLRRGQGLAYCAGDELAAALGWKDLESGAARAQLRFTPASDVVYMECRSGERRALFENGSLRLSLESGEIVASAELSLDERHPQVTQTFADASSTACGLQVSVITRGEEVEACLSMRDAAGQLVYGSLRSRCE